MRQRIEKEWNEGVREGQAERENERMLGRFASVRASVFPCFRASVLLSVRPCLFASVRACMAVFCCVGVWMSVL